MAQAVGVDGPRVGVARDAHLLIAVTGQQPAAVTGHTLPGQRRGHRSAAGGRHRSHTATCHDRREVTGQRSLVRGQRSQDRSEVKGHKIGQRSQVTHWATTAERSGHGLQVTGESSADGDYHS